MPRKTAQPKAQKSRLPVLPLKDTVVFPRMVVPLLVGRPGSLHAVEESLANDSPIFLCTQHNAAEDEPTADTLYRIGVAAQILQTLRLPDGTMKVVVEGLGRGEVKRFYVSGRELEAMVEQIPPVALDDKNATALCRAASEQFSEYIRLSQRLSPEILSLVQAHTEPELVADTICAYLSLRVEERQQLLETLNPADRLERVTAFLMRENELLLIEQQVRDRVREQMERGQREHYLQEQLRAIHQELGNREEGMDEFSEMRALLEKAKLPKEVREKADREFARYERTPMLSPEGAVIRSYLEWLADLPWSKRTKDRLNLDKAQKVLDEDHYGLAKVKERILEFLAVRKLSKSAKGPVLCLVGPPGVGKTSLGQSIARAMNREFVRVSLGGIRDEAEIRGHRRTYIGALPGRVIQSMKRAGVCNPLFMLDEIDKMNSDYRGDPASALLEVLDPAQNKHFSDHFLEVDYDLSEAFFIATANTDYNIPHALYDRMEVVRLPGYTIQEKMEIARRFFVPRNIESCGLKDARVKFADSGLHTIIQRYTREAGVRELERRIAAICRKIARRVVQKEKVKEYLVSDAMVFEYLGPPPYSATQIETEPEVGAAVGMAYTDSGGEILYVETSTMKGKGKLSLTGQLGDVMRESAEAAFTYLRAHAEELGAPAEFHKELDMHVHVPEGAMPKDGPSAGVALTVSMLSALTKKTPLGKLAMTGEITLRGRVLPVGGIKEKVIAAHRAGIRRIVLPKENEKDMVEIPDEVKADVTFDFVERISELLAIAFPEPALEPVAAGASPE